MTEDILFNDIEYGAHMLMNPSNNSFTENFKYANAEFNRLYLRRIRLPEGGSNIVYLLSDSFNKDINLIKSGNFFIPPRYRRVFYPKLSLGTFMGRRYRYIGTKFKKEYDTLISNETRFKPYPNRTLSNISENILFSTSDIYKTIKPIVSKFPIRRIYGEFFKEYLNIIDGMSPKRNIEKEDVQSNNRILIIDADSFSFNSASSLVDNKTNPLFLLYLAFLRTRDLSSLDVDMDMLICSKNMFLKFNPAKLDSKKLTIFKTALFRICKANMEEYIDNLSEEEKDEAIETSSDKIISNIVKNVTEPYTKQVSTSTKITVNNIVEDKIRKEASNILKLDTEIKAAVSDKKVNENIFTKSLEKDKLLKRDVIQNPLDDKKVQLFKAISGDYKPLTYDSGEYIEDDEDYPEDKYIDKKAEKMIEVDANDILVNDADVAEEVLTDIQDKIIPIKNKNAPVNSERDRMLREKQKKIIVKNETIENILERDSSKVVIKSEDKSNVLKTSNKNMHSIKFTNFDKTYLEELFVQDIISCFDVLKDQEYPFYITNIDIKDTSTAVTYKETWTVTLLDGLNKKHTIKVDIPKFIDNRFMYLNGTKFIILKQNFYNPLVKDTPDTLIITTNFNKVTLQRRSTKSLSSVEKIFSLIKKTGDKDMFISGDSSNSNVKYISSLEYDELSKRLFMFKTNNGVLYFSREYINNVENIPKGLNQTEFFIGKINNENIIIDFNTGLDRRGRTIAKIIEENLPSDYLTIYKSIKSPNQSMFVEAKLAGQFIPVATILCVWVGLKKTLDAMNIKWEFLPSIKKIPKEESGKKYIRFADGILEYEAQTFAELILNGLYKMKPENHTFEDFESELGYMDFLFSQWGNHNGIGEIKTFKNFLIDPITKKVCKDMLLPEDPVELLIRAVELLSDNNYLSKASDRNYRVRSIEIIPSILYDSLARQYKAHVKSGGRLPMTLKSNTVISRLIAEKTVEPYSTLNPVTEVSKANTISPKGYRGSNSEYSYDREKRSYDETSIGKLAIQTSADQNVGINRILVVEPTISNARGYRDLDVGIEELKDVNIFSPVEMLTPGTARVDDPVRISIN